MPQQNKKLLPIVVDLDGTLLKTDMLVESAIVFIKRHPFQLFMLLFWLFQGKSILKEKLSEFVDIDVSTLPYNTELLKWISEKKSHGHRLVLASASHKKYVQQIADYLQVFDDTHYSEGHLNLAGANKRDRLVDHYGENQFVYAGNDNVDITIWNAADKAIIVNCSRKLRQKINRLGIEVYKEFTIKTNLLKVIVKAIRIRQWIKNILIFLPLVFNHFSISGEDLVNLTAAFFAFSLNASAVYILNDLLDLPSDRKHRDKKFRPCASGQLNLLHAIAIVPFLLGLSFYIASFIGIAFVYLLMGYLIITTAYSLVLKKIALLDIFLLSALYTTRIFAGTVIIDTQLSLWLFSFSLIFFLSLALVKRYAEIKNDQLLKSVQDDDQVVGRGYTVGDAPFILSLGVGSGIISSIIILLYANNVSPIIFPNSEYIWIVAAVHLYWISRIWFLANRGIMNDDPTEFAVKDRTSLIIGFVLLCLILLAIN